MLISSLMKSVPALSNIALLSGIMLCNLFFVVMIVVIFSVIARVEFGAIDPDHWGSLGNCFVTLFSMLTFDNWSSYYLDVQDRIPLIWLFLAIHILIQSFVLVKYVEVEVVDF